MVEGLKKEKTGFKFSSRKFGVDQIYDTLKVAASCLHRTSEQAPEER